MDSICDYVEVEEQQTREERSNEEVFSTPATIEIIRAMTTRKSENTLQDKFEIIDLLNDTSSDLEEFTDTAVNDNVSSKDGGTLVRDTSPIVSSFSQNTIQSSQQDTQSTVAQSPSRKAKGKSVSKVSKSPQSQLLKKDKAQVVTTHRYETRSKPSRRHTSLSSSNNHNDDNRSDDVSQRSQKLKRSNNDGNAAG
ncbi:3224_t:CDS:2 [Funneliformis caledonium]|uniref:3224_t:CDS:1 n=1 Tax=Funneliformis caledonium TaxID=1117310 RepID=A0A9N8ZT71_9GLOM|nr:3224_t:CDS:2 [Funneliformis caledonium]